MNKELSQLSTMIDFMRWGAGRFVEAELSYSHGMASPLDEAVYLVLRSLNLPVDTPDIYWHSQLTDGEKQKVNAVLSRRIDERIPAAYIMQEGWFAGLQFYIDERVLVPRSPLAELIENQFSDWLDPEAVESALDLCCGSGCIGIACAYAFPYASVDLADVSKEALDVARINIEKHDAAAQVTAIESDLFSALEGKQYDLIVSNPPYVDAEDMSSMADEFQHEPVIGLSSGKDGLQCTREILKHAGKFLTTNGILVVEVGNSQYALADEYPDMGFEWLQFERGGDGVFVLTKQQLDAYFKKFQ